MTDAEIREMIDSLTTQELREMLILLRQLKRHIEERRQMVHTSLASDQPTSSLAANW